MRKIIGVAGRSVFAQRLGSNAAEYAQNYAWDKIATQIVGVYTDVINSTVPLNSLQKVL